MNSHPYLRAYLAGIAVPTCFMLLALTAFFVVRFVYDVPVPIERAIVFPMALVPNIFGVWNMLYLGLHKHRYLPLGVHGAILPFLLAPLGLLLATCLGFLTATSQGVVWFQTVHIRYIEAAMFAPLPIIVYYLVWKYCVGFLNRMLGIG